MPEPEILATLLVAGAVLLIVVGLPRLLWAIIRRALR